MVATRLTPCEGREVGYRRGGGVGVGRDDGDGVEQTRGSPSRGRLGVLSGPGTGQLR